MIIWLFFSFMLINIHSQTMNEVKIGKIDNIKV